MLEEYVRLCSLFYSDSFIVSLDTKQNIVFAGKKYLSVIGKTNEEVIGKSLYSVTPVPENNRKIANTVFPEAIVKQTTKQIFISNLFHPYPDSHILMLLFSPIITIDQQLIAVQLEFTPVEIAYFFQVLIKINKKIEPCDLPDNDDFLTKRQHQVAFLLCHLSDTAEITKIISLFSPNDITSKTVHNIINRDLFTKFKVTKRQDLIEKLHRMGYNTKMPTSLLSNQFIDLTK